MKESNAVKVVVRVRPLFNDADISCVEVSTENPKSITVAYEKSFTFDHIFYEDATQEDVYDTSVKDILSKVIEGYNATVLAYGQTGTGKTYTMGTNYENDNQCKGIIPRVLDDIFAIMKSDAKYSVKVSFLEVYNKSIYDLLTEEKKQIQIHDVANAVKVPKLKIVDVPSIDDALHWLKEGCITRTTAAMPMNLYSSRSHAIFTIYIHHSDLQMQVSKLHLVDLAGSESILKNEKDRLKEGININLELLSLERVMSSLCSGNQNTHIPYRNSILTHLLKDCLCENTLMISCISPADSSMIETINTLRYASRARCIKTKPVLKRHPTVQNSAIKRKLAAVPPTPFTPQINRLFSSTMITPYLPASKNFQPNCVSNSCSITENENQLNRMLLSLPPPSFVLSSPSSGELVEETDVPEKVRQPVNNLSVHEEKFLSESLSTSVMPMDRTDCSMIISPIANKVINMVDATLAKKMLDLQQRLIEVLNKKKIKLEESPRKECVNRVPFQECNTGLIRKEGIKTSNKSIKTDVENIDPSQALTEYSTQSTVRNLRRSCRLSERPGLYNEDRMSAVTYFAASKQNKRAQSRHNKQILKLLNEGTNAAIQTIPCIGPKTATTIIKWREIYGKFNQLSELEYLPGLSKTFYRRFMNANVLTTD